MFKLVDRGIIRIWEYGGTYGEGEENLAWRDFLGGLIVRL